MEQNKLHDLLTKINNLENQIKISINSLSAELIKQPQLFYEVGDLYATAASYRDAAKADLEENDAELGNNFRIASLQEGTKITEGRIQELILSHPIHKQSMSDYIDAKKVADKTQALRDCFSQRSSMLRDLVTLQTTGFSMGTPGYATRNDKVQHEEALNRLALARKSKVN